jgi:hypothetical protein
MIRIFILYLSLFLAVHPNWSNEVESWTSAPELILLNDLVLATMDSYADWSAEFRQSRLEPSEADWTVNLLAEELFIQLIAKMGEHPNPILLRKCLLFLGQMVPGEFDSHWKMVFLELSSNVDRTIGTEVDAELKKMGLMPLVERAMAKLD